jgi:hypothetical protein
MYLIGAAVFGVLAGVVTLLSVRSVRSHADLESLGAVSGQWVAEHRSEQH